MKRHEWLLIGLVSLLAAANLALWWTAQSPSFEIRAEDVVQIEAHRFQSNGLQSTERPTEWTGRYAVLDDPETIATICDVLSSLALYEYPVDASGKAWEAWAIFHTYDNCWVFRLKDGSTRTFLGAPGHLVSFDGRWFYATCGEAYGYQPISKLLLNAFAHARRVEE